MWWRLFVLVLSVVVIIIIIIIIQQFDDVNALQSPILIRSSRKFFEHPLMDYPAQVQKSANLHIYPRWQPWANLHIQDRHPP